MVGAGNRTLSLTLTHETGNGTTRPPHPGDFAYGRVLEDSGRDGNCPDRKRERTTGNVDDQLCVCGMSRAEMETELDL